MRLPISWLREYVNVPEDQSARDIAAHLVRVGFEVESVESLGTDIVGPLVVGVVESIEELTEFKKPIRFCVVNVGKEHGGLRGIVCGARNFVAGDTVVVALPGAVLPGGFAITARETYGKTSDGMICSERELGLSDDHGGIMVLAAGPQPGDNAMTLLGLPDEVLDVSVTPDRGYAMSIRGLAREVATAYGLAFRDPGLTLADLPQAASNDPHDGRIEDGDACDLLVLRTITGFNPAAATPLFMKRRLAMCGMRSISLAVDVTNYVMLELGQPLHAFDKKALRGPIVVRRAKTNETLETLDHVKRTLDVDDLLITDDRGPLSLAGMMGGLESEVSDSSTDLVIEAAHFSAEVTAAMGRRHKLSSEASRRFERGVDRMLPPFASARAVELLLQHGGGTYVGATGVEFPVEPTTLTIAADLPSRIAGVDIPHANVVSALQSVGVHVTEQGATLELVAPSWRPDLTDPYDFVEEVVRLYGYDRLPSTVPQAPSQRGLTLAQRLRRRIGFALAGAGYIEVLQYPFIGQSALDDLAIPTDDERRRMPRLANPLSDEQPFMRSTLLPGLLETLKRNLSRGETDLSLFETGAVNFLRPGQTPTLATDPIRPSVERKPTDDEVNALLDLLPYEYRHVAVVVAGERERSGWWGSGRQSSWADAIEVARVVADAIGVDIQVRSASTAPWHPGRCAELVLVTAHGQWPVGHAGELHPRVIENLGLPARTSAMEMRLDDLLEAAIAAVSATPLNTMPVAKEDVALVVDVDVPSSRVEAALREGAGELLESVRLFDVYTGTQIPAGKKSLAYALKFRASDRTLTDAELATVRAAAVAAAAAEVGAQLRG